MRNLLQSKNKSRVITAPQFSHSEAKQARYIAMGKVGKAAATNRISAKRRQTAGKKYILHFTVNMQPLCQTQ